MNMTSIFPKPYPSQFEFRGESMLCYGSDFRGIIDYTFNDQGYRSYYEFDLGEKDPLLVALGSSITTGHGVELSQSFPSIVAQKLNNKLWNLGQGCFRSSNQTILEQIEFLVNTNLNIDHWVIQFTHINRQGSKFDSYIEFDNNVCVKNFCDILGKITRLLQHKKWCWIMTDWSGSVFPSWVINHPNKVAIDPDSVDFISVEGYQHLSPGDHTIRMLSLHPGPKWHDVMAGMMLDYFDQPFMVSGVRWRDKQLGGQGVFLAQESVCLDFLKKHPQITWCWQGFQNNFYNHCQQHFSFNNVDYHGLVIINSLIGVTPKHFVDYVDSLLHDRVQAAYLAINRYEFIPKNDLDIDYDDDIEVCIEQIVQHISKPFKKLDWDCPEVDGDHFVGMHGLDIFVYECT